MNVNKNNLNGHNLDKNQMSDIFIQRKIIDKYHFVLFILNSQWQLSINTESILIYFLLNVQ